MTTYYVATLSQYALVNAEDEATARVAGEAALKALYAKSSSRIGHDLPIEIRTIRAATIDEIDLMKWHHDMCADHAVTQPGSTPA